MSEYCDNPETSCGNQRERAIFFRGLPQELQDTWMRLEVDYWRAVSAIAV